MKLLQFIEMRYCLDACKCQVLPAVKGSAKEKRDHVLGAQEDNGQPFRSSRQRIPTPHVSLELVEEAFDSAKRVRIFPAADVEALPVSGGRRPSRERLPTPFIKESF